MGVVSRPLTAADVYRAYCTTLWRLNERHYTRSRPSADNDNFDPLRAC